MYETTRTKISKQPSFYPPFAFHLVRTGQLLSSAIVLSILSFFIHYLHLEKFSVPWTFILVRKPLSPSPTRNISIFLRQSLTLSAAVAPYCIHPDHWLYHRDGNPPQPTRPLSENQSPHQCRQHHPLGRWLCPLDVEYQSSSRKPLHTGDMAQ